MMALRELKSARLRLIPATAEIVAADLAGPARLATALGTAVTAEWPPEYYDEGAVRWILKQLQDPAQLGWSSFYLIAEGTLVGLCGFKGPPDDSGTVELGYELVPSAQGLGYATEAVNALVDHALTVPAVARVTARTMPALSRSIGVLERCGFRLIGEGSERGMIRFELTMADAAAGHRTIPPHLHTLFRLQGHMAWADQQALMAIRNAGSGRDQALELLSHVLGAEHVWLSRMQGVPPTVAVWPRLGLDAAAALAEQNEMGFRAFLFNLRAEDLRRIVSYRNSAGEEFATSVEDILLHLFLHGAYHRGQIAQRQRLDGQAPGPSDYIAFARGASAAVRLPGGAA
jgi:RimJ/RimL family protein N-acetyltransferase/uncharacterized damage-inducible protein DinB